MFMVAGDGLYHFIGGAKIKLRKCHWTVFTVRFMSWFRLSKREQKIPRDINWIIFTALTTPMYTFIFEHLRSPMAPHGHGRSGGGGGGWEGRKRDRRHNEECFFQNEIATNAKLIRSIQLKNNPTHNTAPVCAHRSQSFNLDRGRMVPGIYFIFVYLFVFVRTNEFDMSSIAESSQKPFSIVCVFVWARSACVGLWTAKY